MPVFAIGTNKITNPALGANKLPNIALGANKIHSSANFEFGPFVFTQNRLAAIYTGSNSQPFINEIRFRDRNAQNDEFHVWKKDLGTINPVNITTLVAVPPSGSEIEYALSRQTGTASAEIYHFTHNGRVPKTTLDTYKWKVKLRDGSFVANTA